MRSRDEIKFINRIKKLPGSGIFATNKAVMEGFHYFTTDEYRTKPGAITNRIKVLFKEQNFGSLFKLFNNMRKIMPSMMSNIKKNFTDMNEYLQRVENGETFCTSSEIVPMDELIGYVKDKYGVIVGFTNVPQELIFKDKVIPFPYALVVVQEMNRDSINMAPKIEAGIEVTNVYNSLGIITNDIANWIKKRYNIECMANHPLGGLVDTVPLAEKAGLGIIGRNGMLLTREYGPRCRISPIFIDRKLFDYTDNSDHYWMKEFCKKCGKCMRSCPTQAIYKEPKLSVSYNGEAEDRYESYDRERCFISFSATMGCAVCIQCCPFSQKPEKYDTLKELYAN